LCRITPATNNSNLSGGTNTAGAKLPPKTNATDLGRYDDDWRSANVTFFQNLIYILQIES
jgi:hypothetical protein